MSRFLIAALREEEKKKTRIKKQRKKATTDDSAKYDFEKNERFCAKTRETRERKICKRKRTREEFVYFSFENALRKTKSSGMCMDFYIKFINVKTR